MEFTFTTEQYYKRQLLMIIIYYPYTQNYSHFIKKYIIIIESLCK